MTTTYRTIVLHVPPTPLGLLEERWVVDHWCNLCHQRVEPDDLVIHAQEHQSASTEGEGGLPIPVELGHNGVGVDQAVLPISTIITEQPGK